MDTPAISFGTDGWRGVIAREFTYDNVALVGSAICRHLSESADGAGPILVGYDRRFAAEHYAAHLATHLKAEGRRVLLHSEPCPTPVLAFGVQAQAAAGAIMLTASHNPYYYQGLKFIPHFGGPAMPETTDRISTLIGEVADSFAPPRLALQWEGETINLKQAYFDHLDTIVNANSLSASGWRVLYNPMHGTGAGYLDEYLTRADVPVATLNGSRDVYFGQTLPDPSPANLTPLAGKLAEHDCQVLVATDGDADRLGLLDASGRYFGANQALPLLADYLVRYRHLAGDLVRTVSTTHLLDAVAQKHGLALVETPVGFKYVGQELRRGALIGGEESGGISVKGHVPEKDGLLTALLMLELAATSGETFAELLEGLHKELGPRLYLRLDQAMPDGDKGKLFEALATFDDDRFAGKRIASRTTLDGVKFVFEDGGWVLLRASGTEPLVRIYIEVTAPDTMPKVKTQVLESVQQLIGQRPS